MPLIHSFIFPTKRAPHPRMAMLTVPHMAFAFGILGNIVSFLVYLAPLPTFYRIYKRKSTEGFQSIPYSVALFSAMLLLYYAFLKTDNQIMLITINSVGTCIEATYLLVYMIYAPRTAKIYTAKLLLLFNTGVYGAIVLSTFFLSKGHRRTKIVGWVCAAFSLCVFAAPLSIMRLVIRTKSVEYMSFPLSFFLTICAVMWFFYGLLIRGFYIAFPNILGFAFGIAQMILYTIYKNAKKGVLAEFKLQELPNGLVFPTLKKAENTDTNPNDQPEDTAMTEGGARDKAVEPSGELKV